MTQFTVVVLNKKPKLASALISSIQKTHREFPALTVVRDRHDVIFGPSITHIDYLRQGPFSFAAAANIGIFSCADRDVVLLNDDTEMIQQEFLSVLQGEAYSNDKIGLCGASVLGGVGNPYQSKSHELDSWHGFHVAAMPEQIPVCFVAVYLKRAMIDQVGLLDDKFTGYGFEDHDYCIRAIRSGWYAAVTRNAWIQHGDASNTGNSRGQNFSLTYADEPDFAALCRRSQERFRTKYPNL